MFPPSRNNAGSGPVRTAPPPCLACARKRRARLGREGFVVCLAVPATQRGAGVLITRHVVANLEVARHGQGLQLHVDGAVIVEERNSDAVPELPFAALSDDVTN